MSKKKLLEESTIRSFMKLANLQPLTAKFLKEAEEAEEKEDEEEEDESEEKDELKEAEEVEEGDAVAEGKESEGRPASKSQPAKGTSLAGKAPGKMDAAKNAAGDAKLKPLKAGTHHSDKPDSIQYTDKSNAPKKNNSTFEVVAESLQEMEDQEMESPDMGGEAPEAGAEMGSAGEGDEHQGKMKELIRGMLNSLKDMGAEYGMSMEISDEGGEPEAPEADAEMAPPESADEVQDQSMMEEKLDEIVEKLTRRVASRLVKETKKKR
jgi:hypothetical protein